MADQTPTPNRNNGLSRRQFLPGAAGLLAIGAAGVAGYEISKSNTSSADTVKTVTVKEPAKGASTGSADTTDAGLQTFVTRPDLRPPIIKVANLQFPTEPDFPGYIMLAPKVAPPAPNIQDAAMVIDRQGRLIWYHPGGKNTFFDTNAQVYDGKSVLTYWEGAVVNGHGEGAAHILGSDYQPITTIKSANGLKIDLHEFNISSSGKTVFATAFGETTTDLSSLGGSKHGKIYTGHAFEIEIATGKVLFAWNSLDHVSPSESYVGAPTNGDVPYDYFHINSIAEMEDGNLLISGRSCCALYKVDRSTGAIIWRLNGKKSDFKVAKSASFGYQHHVRPIGSDQITIFDNSSMNPIKPGYRSRGMMINFNESTKQVTLAQEYLNPAAFIAMTQGSVQVLSNGNVFVGWGAQPYFSLFSSDGKLLVNYEFAQGVRSYRAFAVDWTGTPTGKPAAVARQAGTGGFVVYASWNGATEIDHWDVLAGSSAGSLKKVGSQPWTDFETAIVTNSSGPSFQAVAVDKNGNTLGRSDVI